MLNIEFSRSLLGAERVIYDCPQCGHRLRSSLAEAGKLDRCPDCCAEFIVPGTERLERLRSENEQAEQNRISEKRRKVSVREQRKKAKAERRAAAHEAAVSRRSQQAIDQQYQTRQQAETNGPQAKKESDTSHHKRHRGVSLAIVVTVICAFVFWLTCGFFVIQPIGAIPDGVTIVYWRAGTKLPFVSSADGLLEESGSGVSLLGRGAILAGLAEPIKERELFRFGFSRTLYLWSTGGK